MDGARILEFDAAVRFPESPRASGSLSVFSPDVLLHAAQQTGRDLQLVLREPAIGKVMVAVFRNGEPTMVFCPGDGRSLGELLLAGGLIDQEALAGLLRDRDQEASGLARLLERGVGLEAEQVQAYLDYQARMRLLEALTWSEGFFEIHDYRGGGETEFSLQLPRLEALFLRARARAQALPELLAQLPGSPAQTLVRRRRGSEKPVKPFDARVYSALQEPILLSHLPARLLVDDDIVYDAVVRLAEGKLVTLRRRAALTPAEAAKAPADPRLAEVVREFLRRARGPRAAMGHATLWVLVVSANPADGARFVTCLGGEAERSLPGGELSVSTGLVSRTIDLGLDAHARLLALRPDRLTRGALEGVLARFEAVVLLRTGDGDEELQELSRLSALLFRESGPKPLALGLDLGASVRRWEGLTDAVFGVPSWEEESPSWLLERLLEGLLAATAARSTE